MNKKLIQNSIYLAIDALKKNKGRTLLTVLGIVIGITAVIAVLSTGQAIKSLILGEVEAFGSNYMQIEVKTPSTSQTSSENSFSMVGGSVITTLKEADGEALLKLSNVDQFYAGIMGQEIVSRGNEFKKAMLFGTNAAFIDIDSSEVKFGRFFTENENQSLSKVVVLGYKLNEKLFGDDNAVGQNIKISNQQFQVVGVLKEKGASFSLDMDNMAFLPLRTLQKRILGVDYVSYILVQMKDKSLSEYTALDATATIRERHKITDPDKDDFAIMTMDQAMEMLDTIIYGIQILLVALGSISLIVGGVGIMNIMYVSVSERTYEIGLRKSLGANKQDILWQFLFEAIFLTLTGGIIGIALGVSISWLVSVIATAIGFEWQFGVSWFGLFIAVFMSMGVGLIFGLYPAKQAAEKSPIEALRQE